jgi:hypothetical protein
MIVWSREESLLRRSHLSHAALASGLRGSLALSWRVARNESVFPFCHRVIERSGRPVLG